MMVPPRSKKVALMVIVLEEANITPLKTKNPLEQPRANSFPSSAVEVRIPMGRQPILAESFV
jgi:hypothetical protein